MKRFCYLLMIGWLSLPLMVNAASMPAAQLSPEQQQWLAQHGQLRVGLVLQAPYANCEQRLQRLSGANVELMKWLAQSLERGVAADPAQRFETAEEWLLQLEQGERQSLRVRPRPLLEREPLKVWQAVALGSLMINLVLMFLIFHH